MKNIWIAIICIGVTFVSCVDKQKPLLLKEGKWHASIVLSEKDNIRLPFQLEILKSKGLYSLMVTNADEAILVSNVFLEGDSIIFEMPVFESKFHTILRNDSLIGTWTKYNNPKYQLPFVAVSGEFPRFNVTHNPTSNVSGKWAMSFSPNDTNNNYPAIGAFKQKGSILTGTIITETGDYRYLDGVVDGNTFHLSTFDGAHAFLFTGHFDNDEVMHGTFYSGGTWKEPFVGYKDSSASLASPTQLTFLKEGYDKFEFSFPNLEGRQVQLSDYLGKPVIVQILGSWCPNCMDETRYYVQLKQKFPELEILGLAYERSEDFNEALVPVKKMIKDLEVNYPILIAGTWNKKKAAESLPMLNHVMSFPTSIFIGRNGEVKRIHTGFYGPGTADYYKAYVKETELLIKKMLEDS